MMAAMELLDRVPPGWFALDVMKAGKNARKWDWCALVVDVPPDDLETCNVDFPATVLCSSREAPPR